MKLNGPIIVSFVAALTLPVHANDPVQIKPNGVSLVSIGEREIVNQMAVYPGGGIAGRPLLVMAHGNGGSGPQEIKGWLDLAKEHNFTIVCPTFLSAVHSMYLPEDAPYFNHCVQWIEENLQYDRKNVYMSGVSGGGFAVWYLGTSRPDFFKGLFLQSANFAGQYYHLDLSKWLNKSIKLIWGSEDLADIPIQNGCAVALLRDQHCKNFSTEVIPGGLHGEHPDMVVSWMEQQVPFK